MTKQLSWDKRIANINIIYFIDVREITERLNLVDKVKAEIHAVSMFSKTRN